MIPKSTQRGFTVIELMIATAVFAAILVVVLTAVTQIGKMYYKGLANSRTQEATRVLLEEITDQLQYSSEAPFPLSGLSAVNDGQTYAFCIGATRYIFVVNREVVNPNHAVWSDRGGLVDNPPCAATSVNMNTAQASPAVLGGRDLLPVGMRLSDIEITPLNSTNTLWSVKIRVAYGANDLLEASDGSPLSASNFKTAVCRGSAIGTQFCAISELQTTVYRRVAR